MTIKVNSECLGDFLLGKAGKFLVLNGIKVEFSIKEMDELLFLTHKAINCINNGDKISSGYIATMQLDIIAQKYEQVIGNE